MLKKLPAFAVAVLIVPVLLLGQGIRVDARTAAEISQDIDRLSRQQSSLDAKIADLEDQISSKRSEIRSLSNDVAVLQQEIDQLELQIDSTEVKIDKTNAEIERTTIEIRATEERIGNAKEQLGALIRLLADFDETDPFELVVANRSFSEILDQVQYAERIQHETQTRLDEVQTLRADLDVQKHNLEVQLREAQNLKSQLQGQQDAVQGKKSEKADLLEQTKGEEANYQKLLGDTEALRKQVQDDINSLQDELSSSAGATPPALGSGIFLEPCNCSITQGFGMTDYAQGGAYGGQEHTGMDFAGPLGSPVFAAADGVVVAKGSLGQAAYGNWLAIKSPAHNVVTLYAHLISLPSIEVGTEVAQGDVVANLGSTGYSSGPHVHFGVSLDDFHTVSKPYGDIPVGTWVNPAPYLAT